MRFAFALFVWILGTNPTSARQTSPPSDTVYTLEPIRITAVRYRLESHEAAQRVTGLNEPILFEGANRHIGEVLDRIGPLFVRRYGNGLATVSLRGSGASQTTVLLDGVPISDPQLGQIDLSLIPAGLIDQAVVVHGAGSSIYGSSSMGGVIDLQTRSADRSPALAANVLAGPYGERSGSFSIAGSSSRLSGRLYLTHETEVSDFPFLNESLFPAQTTRRQGADRTLSSVLGSVQLQGRASNTSASAWISQTERGLPGLATAAPQNERQWDDQFRAWISHTQSLRNSVLKIRGAFQQRELRYLHPNLDIDQAGRTRVVSIEGDWEKSLRKWFDLTTGLEVAASQASHPSLRAGARDTQASLFSLGQLNLGRLTLLPSWRADVFFPDGGRRLAAISPQLGANLQPLRTPRFHIKANAGRAFRAPTFNDRFWKPGGNPTLDPETGWTMEAGASYQVRDAILDASSEITVFRHLFRNQITWLPTSEGFWSPQNISRTQSQGIEVSSRWEVNSKANRLGLRLFYTLVDATDQSDPASRSYGKSLRYIPRHQLKAAAFTGRKFRHLDASLHVFLRHTSLRYVTTDATQYVPAYRTLDIHAKARWRARRTSFTAGLFLENALNSTYEVIRGHPMPPRRFRIQLTVELFPASIDS